MTKIASVSLVLCAFLLGLFVIHSTYAVSPCTHVKKSCDTWTLGNTRCSTGLYSINFTSEKHNVEGVRAYIPRVKAAGEPLVEHDYCGRTMAWSWGFWWYTGEGCGGLHPDNGCI